MRLITQQTHKNKGRRCVPCGCQAVQNLPKSGGRRHRGKENRDHFHGLRRLTSVILVNYLGLPSLSAIRGCSMCSFITVWQNSLINSLEFAGNVMWIIRWTRSTPCSAKGECQMGRMCCNHVLWRARPPQEQKTLPAARVFYKFLDLTGLVFLFFFFLFLGRGFFP